MDVSKSTNDVTTTQEHLDVELLDESIEKKDENENANYTNTTSQETSDTTKESEQTTDEHRATFFQNKIADMSEQLSEINILDRRICAGLMLWTIQNSGSSETVI